MEFPGVKRPQFTPKHKRLLRDLQFDANGPGTILRDFEMFLSFFSAEKSPLTKKLLLPVKTLQSLNARMTRPLLLGLAKPQQKAFPHLEGLYLLLRASGMTLVEYTGKSPVLVMDERALEAWQVLNPTERYCTLLETWLLRGHPQIIGHDRDRQFFIPRAFVNWAALSAAISARGSRPETNLGVADALYLLEAYGLALLELFGLVEGEHLPLVLGAGWQIGRLRRTPLGDALCALLYTGFFDHTNRKPTLEDQPEVTSGQLQPVLQPYLPAWQRTFALPKPEFRKGVHIFRVDLWEGVWRRIAIPAKKTLHHLADAILDAFEFSDRIHLYLFSYRNRMGLEINAYHDEVDDAAVWASEVAIGDLPLAIGERMEFWFDFGDDWRFAVQLERIEPQRTPPVTRAVVIEACGESPDQYEDWSGEP